VLTLLSGSELSSIGNIKVIIPMYTALIFKKQAKVKGIRIKRIGISLTSLPNTNILKGMIFFDTQITNKIYIPQSLRLTTKSTVLVPRIFISSGTD
jgi:hypothetical protein